MAKWEKGITEKKTEMAKMEKERKLEQAKIEAPEIKVAQE